MQRTLFLAIIILFANFSCYYCQVAPKKTNSATKINPIAKKTKADKGTNVASQKAHQNITKENDAAKQAKLINGNKNEGKCILATVFGLETTKTIEQRSDNQPEICHHVQQTCCSKKTFKELPQRWLDHLTSFHAKSESKVRIVRLITQLKKHYSKKIAHCIKSNKPL